MPLPLTARLLTGGFLASGVVHLVRPTTYERLMPPWVPAHREVIRATGVAELVCAVGMAVPATRAFAGYASAALLVGIFPAHIQMAQDALRSRSSMFQAVAFARMPLQVPMIRIALRVAREA